MIMCLNDFFFVGGLVQTGQFPRQEGENEGIRAHFFLLGEWVKEGFKKQAAQIEGGSKGQKD